MAAGALWMGADHIVEFLAYVTIFGGILAVAILGYRNLVPANAFSLPDWARRLHKTGGGIPYGIAIAAGGLMLFPTTELFPLVGILSAFEAAPKSFVRQTLRPARAERLRFANCGFNLIGVRSALRTAINLTLTFVAHHRPAQDLEPRASRTASAMKRAQLIGFSVALAAAVLAFYVCELVCAAAARSGYGREAGRQHRSPRRRSGYRRWTNRQRG